MENKQGMGSMKMGPLLVMTGSDMSIRVGASETININRFANTELTMMPLNNKP